MSVEHNSVFLCAVDGCSHSYNYTRESSLRAHQRKKHRKVYTTSGLVMKRPTTNVPAKQKKKKNLKREHVPSPPATLPDKPAEREHVPSPAATLPDGPVLGSRVEALEDEVGVLRAQLDSAFERAGEAAAQSVGRMMDDLRSEVMANVMEIKDQTVLLAKKTTKWCVICFERENMFAFMPCRHKCVCRRCALDVCKKFRKCPICRQEITGAKPIYDMSAWDVDQEH